jgi:hypothetical protein
VATVSKLSILFRQFKNSYCLEISEFFKALFNFPITEIFRFDHQNYIWRKDFWHRRCRTGKSDA